MLMLLASCKEVEYIHTHTNDTIYRENVKIDSVMLTDSVFLRVHTKGDTVYSEKVKVVYRDRYKYVYDTTYISRVDTIRIPIPIEHKPMIWERITDRFTLLIGAIIIVGFLLWFIGLLRRRK
jgi:hypothetical protein